MLEKKITTDYLIPLLNQMGSLGRNLLAFSQGQSHLIPFLSTAPHPFFTIPGKAFSGVKREPSSTYTSGKAGRSDPPWLTMTELLVHESLGMLSQPSLILQKLSCKTGPRNLAMAVWNKRLGVRGDCIYH